MIQLPNKASDELANIIIESYDINRVKDAFDIFLKRFSSGSIAELLKLAKIDDNKKSKLAQNTIYKLRVKYKNYVQTITSLLDDSNDEVKNFAKSMISNIDDPDSIIWLDFYFKQADPDTKVIIQKTYSKFKNHKKILKYINKGLKDNNDAVRSESINSMISIDDEKKYNYLIKSLKDKSKIIRLKILEYLDKNEDSDLTKISNKLKSFLRKVEDDEVIIINRILNKKTAT